ncbi:hypothetical protein EYF80_027254 [Liparis tanakae]|uniref:Uncharacterized protein n=1 Tax=Liparis tanakae TaxID=230148 RepID=A0A4Z2HAB5_9TELE|nr:hypothetical protein EYF80_027254 [Liparis tanakae]
MSAISWMGSNAPYTDHVLAAEAQSGAGLLDGVETYKEEEEEGEEEEEEEKEEEEEEESIN